jgi:galactonate dehydratase
MTVNENSSRSRRAFIKKAFASMAIGSAGAFTLPAALSQDDKKPYPLGDEGKESIERYPDRYKGKFRITRLETFKVYPRWLFLKIHTNQGITGLGEPIVEGRADTVATAVKEIEPYLAGQDPRRVVHHWQAIYRHAFYRGGPVLTSA